MSGWKKTLLLGCPVLKIVVEPAIISWDNPVTWAAAVEEWWAQYGVMDLDGESTTPQEVQALRKHLDGTTTPLKRQS